MTIGESKTLWLRRTNVSLALARNEILTETIDAKGVLGILRDWCDNRAGRDDPKAMDKLEHGEKVIEAQKWIAVPRRQLAS